MNSFNFCHGEGYKTMRAHPQFSWSSRLCFLHIEISCRISHSWTNLEVWIACTTFFPTTGSEQEGKCYLGIFDRAEDLFGRSLSQCPKISISLIKEIKYEQIQRR